MSTFQNILVAIDTSHAHHPLLERAARLAEMQKAALTVVDVVPELTWAQRLVMDGAEHVHELLIREKSAKLRKLAASLRKRGLTVKNRVLVGRTSEELIRQVLRGKHDVVLREAKGARSRRPGFFGMTAMELLRKCPCPVWLINSSHEGPVRRVLAAVDTNPEKVRNPEFDEQILRLAQAVAGMFDARLDVLHVWSIYGERIVRDYMKTNEFHSLEQAMHREHGECLHELVRKVGLSPESDQVHLIRGDAAAEIPAFVTAHEVDLLVMGTLARSGVAGLLMGNTAEIILNQLQCSVLTLKPAGFVTPVKRAAPKNEPPVPALPPIPVMPPIP